MAHAFDTSLARAQRTLIRSGAVTLLSGLLRPAGYLQAVIPWGGVVRGFREDPIGIDMLWTALAGRAPAIAIALGDRATTPAGMGGFNFKSELDLYVYFVSNHPRDSELGRHEIDIVGLAANTADPGLDVMLEHAEELLVGQRCGASATVKQIVPVREEECRTEPGLTLWMQRYTVTVARTIDPHRSITELLAGLDTKIRTSDQPPPAAPVVELESNTTD